MNKKFGVFMGAASRATLLLAYILAAAALNCFGAANGGQTAADILNIVPDAGLVSIGGNTVALPSDKMSGGFSNPASLNGVDRAMLTFYQAYYPLGLNYNYTGFAMPTQFGKVGVSFGVMNYTGIDSYNSDFTRVSLADSYDAVVSAAYAMPIAKQVPVYKEYGSVGVGIKLLESKLAYYNSEAVAIDLGGIYNIPYVDGFTLGLSFKNIGNDMKYVESSFSIPTSINIGLGYNNKEYEEFTAALGFSMPKNANSYPSMGVSVKPLYFLRLSAGYRDFRDNLFTGFSTGFGLEFGHFRLEYAFLPAHMIGASHFLSFSVDIGSVVQLKSAPDVYLERHYRKAVDAYMSGDYVEARQKFEEIMSVYPGHGPSMQYLEKIADKIDRSVELKDAKISYYMEIAQSAADSNDFITAKKYYSYIVSLSPENEQARVGLEKLWRTIQDSKSEKIREEQRVELEDLWESARTSSAEGNFVEAKGYLQEMLAVDPNNNNVKTAIVEIDNQLAKVAASQVKEIFARGMQLFKEGNFREALTYFEAVTIAAPNRRDAKDYAAQCQQAIFDEEQKAREERLARERVQVKPALDQVYDKALTYYERSNYAAALDFFNKGEELAVRYEFDKYLENIKKYKEIINSTLSEKHYKAGYAYANKKELELAASEYKKALEYNPDNLNARMELEKLSRGVAQLYYEKGMTSFARGDLGKAREMFRKSLYYEPTKVEAQRALDRVK